MNITQEINTSFSIRGCRLVMRAVFSIQAAASLWLFCVMCCIVCFRRTGPKGSRRPRARSTARKDSDASVANRIVGRRAGQPARSTHRRDVCTGELVAARTSRKKFGYVGGPCTSMLFLYESPMLSLTCRTAISILVFRGLLSQLYERSR